MALHNITAEQKIPATLEQVWDFISSPKNLKDITPAYMGFEITTKNLPDKMYPGMMISYKVSPILGVKLKWVTEITHVDHLKYFVDEQRMGPYKIWHHQHHIKEIDGGVHMLDIVDYAAPMGILGDIANSLFIKKQLATIFDFRTKAVDNKFGKY
jgi:ligand-binding SRPBCC domain-containing protein